MTLMHNHRDPSAINLCSRDSSLQQCSPRQEGNICPSTRAIHPSSPKSKRRHAQMLQLAKAIAPCSHIHPSSNLKAAVSGIYQPRGGVCLSRVAAAPPWTKSPLRHMAQIDVALPDDLQWSGSPAGGNRQWSTALTSLKTPEAYHVGTRVALSGPVVSSSSFPTH